MYNYEKLHMPEPKFGSELTKLILELDRLRHLQIGGTTPVHIFFQLKDIFHLLESIGSARIEGNRTTIAEYVENKIIPEKDPSEEILEIQNNEKAIVFIEQNINSIMINRFFISELHKIIVKDLKREGDSTPGKYRSHPVSIKNSKHIPPEHFKVEEYMNEMIDFINMNNDPQYDLLKTAIVHHRFAWIHPFGNGNGRTVRALTYAMLIKQGFNLEKGRLVNPTAIFCSNRNKYYDMLEKADSGKDEDILIWSEYVLRGLGREIEKIDKLTNYDYLKNKILNDIVGDAIERKLVNEREGKVLKIAIEKKEFQALDIKHLFTDNTVHTEISRFIRKMKEKKLILPITKKARKYTINISNGYLLRSVMRALDKNNFLPLKNEVD